MISVGVSGAGGRMGRLVSETVAAAEDLSLVGLYDPHHIGEQVAGLDISGDRAALSDAQVVVEFTRPDVVIDNLTTWRDMSVHAVVGTSGFTSERLTELAELWGNGPPNCLVVPNFSVGAVLMMRFAEMAAPHFSAAEIIELHHDAKVDAPSGTAASTAERIGLAQPRQTRAVESTETVPGARGGSVAGVPVHAVRLPGLLAHQEVLLGSQGETLIIRHDTTDRSSFMPGVLLAIRGVERLAGLTVGIESLLDL